MEGYNKSHAAMTTFDQLAEILSSHREEVVNRFRVKEMAVFGSYSRGDQRPNSDVDILVDFSAPVGIEFIDLGDYLEKILSLRVDLVSRNGIKAGYFDEIRADLKYV